MIDADTEEKLEKLLKCRAIPIDIDGECVYVGGFGGVDTPYDLEVVRKYYQYLSGDNSVLYRGARK